VTPTELLDHIRLHLEDDRAGIAGHLEGLPPADVVEVLNRLTRQEAATVLTLLPAARAVAVCNQATLARRGAILEQLPPEQAVPILEQLRADERAAVLREISPHERARCVARLSPAARADAERLLRYRDRTAGGIMTTEFVRLRPDMTVGQALKHVRAVARQMESIYACYVLEPGTDKLLGAVSLRDLVMAELSQPITEVMRRRPITVAATEDQEEVARRIGKYNLLAVPVLEADGRVVGFVTVDDVIDVMTEEQTEDILKMGGLEGGALDTPYLTTPFRRLVRKRATWLVVLFLGEMLTATAMGFFEEEIARAVVLALFVPLIISSGGNSGSQAATLVIRAMALGEVTLRDWWRVMRREVFAGLALGGILGTIGFLRIAVWTIFTDIYGPHWPLIAVTVGLSLVGIVLWGTLSGSMLPILLRRLGLDPATSSAPFVATLVDVTGLVIYFGVAAVILHGTLL
jgi:magnesium transporter